jgi:catechol 2,3-dioxygenase-like lactoylglutathione lyase family enzyme
MTDPAEVYGVRLLVRDFPASYRFYHDTLGLASRSGHGEPPYAELFGGERMIGLFDRSLMRAAIGARPGAELRPAEDSFAIVLSVRNVDRTYEELRRKGIEFVHPPTDRKEWSLRTAHLRDPDGNLVELCEDLPPAEGPARP